MVKNDVKVKWTSLQIKIYFNFNFYKKIYITLNNSEEY